MNSPRSVLLDRPGAVDGPDSGHDAGVPLHYGDPLAEQRAAADGVVVVDRSHRDVVSLTGPERLTWLEGFVSQHVSELGDAEGGETLVLDANGRVEHHALVSDLDGVTLLDTEPGRGADLLAFLQKMVFWAQVTPGAADLAVLTLAGSSSALGELRLSAPDGPHVVLPAAPHASVALPGGGRARRVPWPGDGSVDLLVPRADLGAWADAAVAAGARPAGSWAFEALRVAAPAGETRPLRARLGVDTDERTIPHEVPAWIGDATSGGAVHLDKGCYRGQETVSRVHNLGRSPRVLVRLHLDGSGTDLPAPGDPVTAGGRTVGRVGTVVHHHADGPVALALVKRGIPADADLDAGADGVAVAAGIDADTLPGESAPQAGREAVRRLRGN